MAAGTGVRALMQFTPAAIDGVYTVELEPHRDDRGYLARAYCADEFAAHGLNPTIVQANLSFSERAGTLP